MRLGMGRGISGMPGMKAAENTARELSGAAAVGAVAAVVGAAVGGRPAVV
jgi:hypothetical protein